MHFVNKPASDPAAQTSATPVYRRGTIDQITLRLWRQSDPVRRKFHVNGLAFEPLSCTHVGTMDRPRPAPYAMVLVRMHGSGFLCSLIGRVSTAPSNFALLYSWTCATDTVLALTSEGGGLNAICEH